VLEKKSSSKTHPRYNTASVLLCSSFVEAKSWGMLPGSQHFEGVEGCAGAPGWD